MSQSEGEPPIRVRSITSSSQIDLPVARYAATAADERAYLAAVNIAQRSCAEDFGVRSTLPVAKQPSLIEMSSTRRYGVIDRDDVARYGYAPPPVPGQDEDKSAGWNPGAQEALVMQGVRPDGTPVEKDPQSGKKLPKDGCSAQGFRDLDHGEVPPPRSPVVEEILREAWELTMTDSRALAVAKRWSACMSEHGYDFKHRWDAGNSVGNRDQKTQIAMAELDLSCATKTGYLGVWYAVDTAYQERLIERRQGELQATVAEHRDVMERVRATLQAGS